MGADNGMDASPSWQELKDERDMWKEEAALKAAEAEAFMIQRDKLREALEEIADMNASRQEAGEAVMVAAPALKGYGGW